MSTCSRPVDRDALRVVIVTGIFPPDIGGPATHAADLQAELRDRGNEALVVTLTDQVRRTDDDQTVRFPRRWPWPARLVAVAVWLIRNRRRYDVVYATGLHPAAVAGARIGRKPVVVKVVGDPAWERGVRLELTASDIDAFQDQAGAKLRLRLMRMVRNWSVRKATAVTAPSAYLAAVAGRWIGRGSTKVRVIPNGVRLRPTSASRGAEVPGLATAGRLVAHKRIDTVLHAVSKADGVELVVIGDGPERERLEIEVVKGSIGDRVTFTGTMEHRALLERLSQMDALVVASSYEGLPHVVLEALALGVPVVASRAGGNTEVIKDGVNGLIVDPPDAATFAAAFERLRDDAALRTKLRAGARESSTQWRFDRCADEIESLLRSLVARRPRVVNLGKTWTDNPPGPDLERKFTILARHLDATIISTGPIGVRRVAGVRLVGLPSVRPRLLGGMLFYPAAGLLAITIGSARHGSVVVCQSPFEALSVLCLRRLVPAKRRPRTVVEVHGDWRTASRLYGSRWRRPLAPVADRLAQWSLCGADRIRVIGSFTADLVRDAGYHGEVDRFVAFSGWQLFFDPDPSPILGSRRAVFIGVLEAYKAPDVLVEAWPHVVRELPDAQLTVVGDGQMLNQLRARSSLLGITNSIEFIGSVPRTALVDLLDDATCLVLPSRSEGLGRVVLEAMARARPVVASRSGGIPELVIEGETGLLVRPGEPKELAAALVELLADRPRAAQMGAEARRRALARDPAKEFEAGVARLAAWAGNS